MNPTQKGSLGMTGVLALAMVWIFSACLGSAAAETVRIAVAANFADVAGEIAAGFTAETGHKVELSPGSTGQLYAKIANGAPYDVFLAADQLRPEKAEAEGLGVAGTRFDYAIGRLVLFTAEAGLTLDGGTLAQDPIGKLAIANPATAPYGQAAIEVLQGLNVLERWRADLVQGTSIAQTFQFVATGNARLGLVALSQVIRNDQGSRWLVPAGLHNPIAQSAILLQRGSGNAAAQSFLRFLRGAEAATVIRAWGYDLPPR